jgi:drug/metabolite transporter (DMT)-like permease
MNSSIRALPIILLSVLCSSTAHLLLKKGATALFETSGGATLVARALGNPWLWGGIALHAIALLTWVVALGKAELSFAYPFIALGFVLTALFAWLFMREVPSMERLAGMGLIMIGLVLVARG